MVSKRNFDVSHRSRISNIFFTFLNFFLPLERLFSLERPPGLKLILKVGGSNSTPEHGSDSPAYGIHSGKLRRE